MKEERKRPPLETFSLRGQGTVPVGAGYFGVTYPLAYLEAGPDGILVEIRPHWIMKVSFIAPSGPQGFHARWEDLEYALHAKRSVVLQRRDGRFSRIVPNSPQQILVLVTALEKHGIDIRTVRNTIRHGFAR